MLHRLRPLIPGALGVVVVRWPRRAGNPAVSPVRHTYETRSDRSTLGVNGAYRVRVSVLFTSEFRVIGPGFSPDWLNFTTLGFQPLAATAVQDYKVGEVISTLTGPTVSR